MGGVAGHMSHLYEDLDLTFDTLRSILTEISVGRVATTEKVDGINMFFSVDKSGQPVFARNKSDIKFGGQSLEEIRQTFSGHPAESPITEGCAAISRMLNFRTGMIFGTSGKNWANAEIILAERPVSIRYSQNCIVLHGLKAFHPATGKPVHMDLSDRFARLVENMEDTTGTHDSAGWSCFGPIAVVLPNRSGTGTLAEALRACRS